MKKFSLIILIAICCSPSFAQYKKASFLNKNGRTYDLGLSGRFLTGGAGTVPGIFYSYGKDNGKLLFHWFDLELLLPTKFTYTTADINTKVPVVVTGTSKLGLVYRYNLGCYLIKPNNDKTKLLPFVTGGINMLVAGGSAKPLSVAYTSLEQYPDPEVRPTSRSFSYGGNLGAGVIYRLKESLGLKLAGGYDIQRQVSTDSFGDSGYSAYQLFTNHPYLTLSVRFVMERD